MKNLFQTILIVVATGLIGPVPLMESTYGQGSLPTPRRDNLVESLPRVQPTRRPLRVRIKDITDIEGIRVNKITGFGLVVGLNGTGGDTPDTRQFALNVLENYAMRTGPDIREAIRNNTQFRTDNVSVVVVSAELPAFPYPGQKIDVSVSIFDNGTSLQDGKLMTTALTGYDGKVYAVADGAISLGAGFGASGNAASVQKNALTTGRIPGGAIVEEKLCEQKLGVNGFVNLFLRNADLETAIRVAKVVNEKFPEAAKVQNQRTIQIRVPNKLNQNQIHEYLAKIRSLSVTPDSSAKVVINERNGTIIVGENVRLSRIGIKFGNITVTTAESPQVSQPAPFSRGQTQVVPKTNLQVFEDRNALNVIDASQTLVDLAESLNALGVTAKEMSAILQEIKSAGQLHGELIFD